MCRKLETETEKVLPFYASSLAPEEDDDVAAAMQEAPSEPLAEVKKIVPHPYPYHHLKYLSLSNSNTIVLYSINVARLASKKV